MARMFGFLGNRQFHFHITHLCFISVIKRHVILDSLVVECLPHGGRPQVDSNRRARFLNCCIRNGLYIVITFYVRI
jgi:hypothetical protein